MYLKIQPCRQNAFVLGGSLKQRSKFYGPYKVIERIGYDSYTLQLSAGSAIHPVFHVSQLKKHVGHQTIPLLHVPLVTLEGRIKTILVDVLEK